MLKILNVTDEIRLKILIDLRVLWYPLKLKEKLASRLIVLMTLIQRRVLQLAQINIWERVYIVLVHLIDVSYWSIIVRLPKFESLFMICVILFIIIIIILNIVVILIFHFILFHLFRALRHVYLLSMQVILWINKIWLIYESSVMNVAAHVW